MTRAKGVDVSKWQPTTPDLTGLSFLIARATVGLQKDALYDQHIANARKAGLIVGAYAFTYNTIDAADQADAFFRAAGDVDLYFDDVEGTYAFTRTQVAQFRNRGLSRWGKDSGLYMSESGFYREVPVAYRWVANWSRTPSIAWDFWQNRGSPLDLDQFNGTAADLRAFVGIPPAPPSDVGEMPIIVGDGGRVLGDVPANTPYYDAPNGKQIGTTSGRFEWHGSPTLEDGVTRDPDWVLIVGLDANLNRVGGVARYIKRAALSNPRAFPTVDCGPAVKAATDPLKAQLAAEMARANAAESRVRNAQVALGCTPSA